MGGSDGAVCDEPVQGSLACDRENACDRVPTIRDDNFLSITNSLKVATEVVTELSHSYFHVHLHKTPRRVPDCSHLVAGPALEPSCVVA